MLGAESRLESRLNKLESLMRNPQSALNLETLLVSFSFLLLLGLIQVEYRRDNNTHIAAVLWVVILSWSPEETCLHLRQNQLDKSKRKEKRKHANYCNCVSEWLNNRAFFIKITTCETAHSGAICLSVLLISDAAEGETPPKLMCCHLFPVG